MIQDYNLIFFTIPQYESEKYPWQEQQVQISSSMENQVGYYDKIVLWF